MTKKMRTVNGSHFVLEENFLYWYNRKTESAMEYLKNGKKNTKAVLLSIEEYEDIQREIEYYKKTIEELQDELDSTEAGKIRKEGNAVLDFRLNDYVSDKNRAISSKSLKKAAGNRSGKTRKVYS
jgi:PHD/YefM family antitoxin component YafN of YafNO toxin-antitoxin module